MCKKFNATIIGLGLIGGSIAYNLTAMTEGEVFGYDKNDEVLSAALLKGAIKTPVLDENFLKDALSASDFVFLCLYPNDNIAFIQKHLTFFKKGSIITDVSGIKSKICAELDGISSDFTFIGGHPMAGKEVGTFYNSSKSLFSNCYYIITPSEGTSISAVTALTDVIKKFNVRDIIITNPKKHDRCISLTSSLPHVIAACACNMDNIIETEGFTAGSFADMVRVAKINAPLWAELMLENEFLPETIDGFISKLLDVKGCLKSGDKAALTAFLKSARDTYDGL